MASAVVNHTSSTCRPGSSKEDAGKEVGTRLITNLPYCVDTSGIWCTACELHPEGVASNQRYSDISLLVPTNSTSSYPC